MHSVDLQQKLTITRSCAMLRVLGMAVALCLATSAQAQIQYSYQILDKKPQARDLFVQGLEIHDNQLYLSAGNYGESRLLRYHFDSGNLETMRKLHPRIFAEGITVLNGRIYQLTWRERMMLVFSKDEMKALEWFPLVGQGWGLTNNGTDLIYSDGSDQLHYLSTATKKITHSVTVTENGVAIRNINELEWIDGKIWANIWQQDRIVIIDPTTGAVSASIDLSGLLPVGDRRSTTGVLNGIARNPTDGSVWVTGKRWPWLYQIEIIEKIEHPATGNSR